MIFKGGDLLPSRRRWFIPGKKWGRHFNQCKQQPGWSFRRSALHGPHGRIKILFVINPHRSTSILPSIYLAFHANHRPATPGDPLVNCHPAALAIVSGASPARFLGVDMASRQATHRKRRDWAGCPGGHASVAWHANILHALHVP
jgi:hypothetical protein